MGVSATKGLAVLPVAIVADFLHVADIVELLVLPYAIVADFLHAADIAKFLLLAAAIVADFLHAADIVELLLLAPHLVAQKFVPFLAVGQAANLHLPVVQLAKAVPH